MKTKHHLNIRLNFTVILAGICLFLSGTVPLFGGVAVSQTSDLSMLSTLPTDQLLKRWDTASRGERSVMFDLLAEKRSETLTSLRKLLSTGTESEIMLACHLLSDMRDRGAVSDLLGLTYSGNPKIALSAVNALREIGDPRVLPRMQEILSEKQLDLGEKICALAAIGRLGSTRDAALIRTYLTDPAPPVATSAAMALAMVGKADGEQILLQMTESDDPFTQKLATKGLGYLTTPKAQQKLETILSNPSASWKSYAHIAVEQQRLKTLGSPEAQIDALSQLLTDKNKMVAGWALGQLVDTNLPDAIQKVQEHSKMKATTASQAMRLLKLRGLEVEK
jgi:HEAT repeat protein